jgi:arylsulfatase A-like enzyme
MKLHSPSPRLSVLIALLVTSLPVRAQSPPNIVYILCDDLGYGDVQALNPTRGKIATPNIDRLASQGMTFTDAHSGSSVCTPTRYGILTGRYAWRSRLQSGTLIGDSPPLIASNRLTVPAMLKQHGYTTAAMGKWHLGLTFGENRWVDPIRDGPLQHGFDSFFGISASLDMPPFAYIENDRFPQPPTVEKKWVRSGPAAKDFDAENVLPDLTARAVQYLAARDRKQQPFFLYLAFSAPHTPILPTKQWQGKSGLGPYGDFVMEVDWATGQVLDAIDHAGLADDTLVIFTSDNGCAPAADVKHLEAQGHFPSAIYRGYKADIWDGGHRIPFIARWPGHIRAGSRSDTTMCLTDLMATCGELLEHKLPPDAGEDSVSILPILLGRADATVGRKAIVHHSNDGYFAIRRANWKLELCAGSGGWAAPREPAALQMGMPREQLYDLAADPSEQHNLAADRPDVVQSLTALLTQYLDTGRSTPGLPQKNDVPIVLRKTPRRAATSAASSE